MATIYYTKYSFAEPEDLMSKEEFISMKTLLTNNPDYSLNYPDKFPVEKKNELTIGLFGLFGLYISSLDIPTLVSWLVGIPSFVCFIYLLSAILSFLTYSDYKSDKKKYFKKLKKNIIKSKDYNDFINLSNQNKNGILKRIFSK